MVDPIPEQPQCTTMSGCFMRVVWAMFGPALVLVSTFLIIANKSAYGTFPDFILLGGAGVGVAARFLDPGVVDPRRNDGDIGKVSPRRYALVMLIGAGLVLVAAHSMAPLFH